MNCPQPLQQASICYQHNHPKPFVTMIPSINFGPTFATPFCDNAHLYRFLLAGSKRSHLIHGLLILLLPFLARWLLHSIPSPHFSHVCIRGSVPAFVPAIQYLVQHHNPSFNSNTSLLNRFGNYNLLNSDNEVRRPRDVCILVIIPTSTAHDRIEFRCNLVAS